MKHISILIPHDAVMASIVDPRILFTGVNDFLESVGKPPAFKVQLVGLTKEVQLHNGTFTVHTDALISDLFSSWISSEPSLLKSYASRNWNR